MENDGFRLRHNSAVRGAKAMLDVACNLLYEWEKRDFYDEAYEIILKALEEAEAERKKKPPEPSRN